jgi:RND superfamily putative drug exporter
VNGTAFMLYGIPSMYEQIWTNVNETAGLLYGGPAAYMQAWLSHSTELNNTTRNKMAFDDSWTSINATITDPAQRAMLLGYHQAYHTNWNSSFDNHSQLYMPPATSPTARADVMVDSTAPLYFNFTNPVNQGQQFMAGIWDAFSVTNFTDPTVLNAFTNSSSWTTLQSEASSYGIPPDQMAMLAGYFDQFAVQWNLTFHNTPTQNLSAPDRASLVVGLIAPTYIDQVSKNDPTVKQMMLGVLQAFNLTDWNDTTMVNKVTNMTFYSTMQAMVGGLGLPPSQEDQLWRFYNGFYSSWKGTFQGPKQYNTSLARAEAAVRAFAPGFIAAVNQTDPLQAGMLQGVFDNFNTSTWSSTDKLNSYARFYFTETLSTMASNMGVSPEQALQMLFYFDTFVDQWDKSFKDPKLANLTSTRRAENAVAKVAPDYIVQVSNGDMVRQSFLQGVLAGFNGTDWNDTSRINEFSRSYFRSSLSAMASQMGVPSDQVVQLTRYFDLFYVQWNASFQLPLEGYTSLDRADFAAKSSAPGYIHEVAAGNVTVKNTMLSVLNTLNITTWNDTKLIDDQAYTLVYTNIGQMGKDMGLSKADISKATNYLSAFYTAWKASYNVTSLKKGPIERRAEWAIPTAMANFTIGLTADESHYLRDVQAGLTLNNWNNTTKQETLANGMTSERAWTVFNSLLGNMSGGQSMNDTTMREIKGYFDVYSHNWNWSFIPTSSNYMPRGTTSLVRGKSVVDGTAPDFFGFSTPTDEGDRFMRAVWQNFTLQDWDKPGPTHNFTVDFLYSRMSSNPNAAIKFKRSFFEDIYKLGSRPTQAAVERFTDDTLRHGTLDTYPLTLSHSIVSEFINEKNDTMLIVLGFNKGTGGKYDDVIKGGMAECGRISKQTGKADGLTGLASYVSGSAPLDIQLTESVNSDINRIDIVTAIVVLVLISLFFRSPVTAVIPLAIIGAAIMVTYGAIFFIGSYLIKIHYTVITLTFTALMGAGVDYCIFIVARYKEERKKGKDKEAAIRTAVTWAGESITTSGLAVMIGFGGLSVLTFSMVQGMGMVLPIGIGIAILVALTFLPSIIMLVGDGIFWTPKFLRKAHDTKAEKERKRKERLVRARHIREAARRPRLDKDGGRREVDRHRVFYFSSAVDVATKYAPVIVILAIIISIPASIAVLSLETSYDFFSGIPNSEAKKGLDVMAEGFGKSRGMETKVVIDMGRPVYDNKTGTYDTAVLRSVDDLATRIRGLGAVKRVDPSTYSEGSRIDHVDCWSTFGDAWKDQCLGSALGKFNRTIVITVTLKEEPFAKGSIDSINSIRDQVKKAKSTDPVLSDAKILVGGATAGMTDIEHLIDTNMQEMRVIVIVAIFILLMIVLGSVLIPITAIVSIGLSISWTLAVALLLFQYVRNMPLLWLMPIILFVVLMGLGMDYNIFIITRMREEVMRGYSDRVAIRRAVERTGGIITACGAIMAGAFGSMMLSVMGLLQQFGFALFFAIILDAFIIRIYLMPAIVVLLRKWNWWAPGPLQRVRRDKKGRVIMRGSGIIGEEGLTEEE